ncbi:hypothetical protein CI109_101430 [Kwoniella shandongensis]|uniref:Uncharacterized protein n=1 Tax=Kwoniella shandongensis TaxID=1734106 RepID=A0A5M6BWN4_9TREE|nr:uncharacterized protein CI109_005126 [Kwoniella shandongensis]KAA5526550.1 hypothetical protein CI109_005126 [Kwoniella shandongensis]
MPRVIVVNRKSTVCAKDDNSSRGNEDRVATMSELPSFEMVSTAPYPDERSSASDPLNTDSDDELSQGSPSTTNEQPLTENSQLDSITDEALLVTMQNRIRSYQQRVQQAKTNLNSSLNENTNLRAQVEKLQGEMRTIATERDRIGSQLNSKTKMVETLESRMDIMSASMNDKDRTIVELRSIKDEYVRSKSIFEMGERRICVAHINLKELERKNDEIQRDKDKLQLELESERAKRVEEKRMRTHESIKRKYEEIARLQEDLEARNDDNQQGQGQGQEAGSSRKRVQLSESDSSSTISPIPTPPRPSPPPVNPTASMSPSLTGEMVKRAFRVHQQTQRVRSKSSILNASPRTVQEDINIRLGEEAESPDEIK